MLLENKMVTMIITKTKDYHPLANQFLLPYWKIQVSSFAVQPEEQTRLCIENKGFVLPNTDMKIG